MNKSYCGLFFNEIYSENRGCYNVCCLGAPDNHLEKKFKTKEVTPFEFFLSKEMDEIREKALKGELIDSCKICYDEEELVGNSKRLMYAKQGRNIPPPTKVEKVTLKLRAFGNYCNLSCISCHPFNSTGRIKELTATGQLSDESLHLNTFSKVRMGYKEWQATKKDILDNIDKIAGLHLQGGEPLLIPQHWQLLMEDISAADAKNIRLHYNTNLTKLEYKNYTVYDLFEKFAAVDFSVSCDHFGDKLHFMRYPIDVEEFENNLIEVWPHVSQIACTVQLLNVNDLPEIKYYYEKKYKIPVVFTGYVTSPEFMNIRHLPKTFKEKLIERYEGDHLGDATNNFEWDDTLHYKFGEISPNLFVSELRLEAKKYWLMKGFEYLDTLGKHRGIDWMELWSKDLKPLKEAYTTLELGLLRSKVTGKRHSLAFRPPVDKWLHDKKPLGDKADVG